MSADRCHGDVEYCVVSHARQRRACVSWLCCDCQLPATMVVDGLCGVAYVTGILASRGVPFPGPCNTTPSSLLMLLFVHTVQK